MKLLQRLTEQKLIHPPKWLPVNVQYMAITGSVSYGASSDTSDCDFCGFAIPTREDLFPWLRGEIPGFGTQIKRFEQWQEHHVEDKGANKQYDFTVFSIVKFFHLCLENNPNALDTLFTPVNCVVHSTAVGNLMRDNRKKFLHKGCWPKLKGYSFSQMFKLGTKSHEGLDDLIKFENDNDINNKTTFQEVEDEIKRRNLL